MGSAPFPTGEASPARLSRLRPNRRAGEVPWGRLAEIHGTRVLLGCQGPAITTSDPGVSSCAPRAALLAGLGSSVSVPRSLNLELFEIPGENSPEPGPLRRLPVGRLRVYTGRQACGHHPAFSGVSSGRSLAPPRAREPGPGVVVLPPYLAVRDLGRDRHKHPGRHAVHAGSLWPSGQYGCMVPRSPPSPAQRRPNPDVCPDPARPPPH